MGNNNNNKIDNDDDDDDDDDVALCAQCTRQYMAVGTECVEGKDYLDTVNECYQQSVRWQW
jgi:hypothetical protein